MTTPPNRNLELDRKRYAKNKESGRYRCEPCDKNFQRAGALKKHKYTKTHGLKVGINFNINCYLIYWDEFPEDKYVGSTVGAVETLERFSGHRSDFKRQKGAVLLSEAVNRNGDGWKYRFLGTHSVADEKQKRQWEQKYIDEQDTLAPKGLNKYRAYNSPEQALEQIRESVKKWQSNNKEYMKAYDKERDKRPERRKYNREYREKNKQKQKEYNKEYHAKHKGVKKQDRPKEL